MSAVAWLQLLIFTFFAGVLLNFPWLVYFSVAVTLVMATAHLWRSHALDHIQYTRRFHFTRGFPGEKTEVRLTIVNNKLLPISWLRASDTWFTPVGPEDENALSPSYLPNQGFLINLYSLRWRERITRTYSLRFRKRGIYEIGPVLLEAGDLFGLYETKQEIAHTELLTVFPEILSFERLNLPAEDPFGDRRARKPLFEDPSQAMGIRPYQPEDGFRHIHWPATARSGALQVKVFQPVTARVLVICMDVSTEEHYWLGFSPEILEELVKVCATLAYQGIEDGYSVGLFSNGCLAHADQPFRIQPGRSANQLTVLLQALAGVTPFISAAFETFLIRSMSDIPFGSSLILVTAHVPETLQNTLLRLRRYRQHITLITLQETPPPDLPGIRLVHLPYHSIKAGDAQ
jgi:uncharacterized protein (DUF58 family)